MSDFRKKLFFTFVLALLCTGCEGEAVIYGGTIVETIGLAVSGAGILLVTAIVLLMIVCVVHIIKWRKS